MSREAFDSLLDEGLQLARASAHDHAQDRLLQAARTVPDAFPSQSTLHPERRLASARVHHILALNQVHSGATAPDRWRDCIGRASTFNRWALNGIRGETSLVDARPPFDVALKEALATHENLRLGLRLLGGGAVGEAINSPRFNFHLPPRPGVTEVPIPLQLSPEIRGQAL